MCHSACPLEDVGQCTDLLFLGLQSDKKRTIVIIVFANHSAVMDNSAPPVMHVEDTWMIQIFAFVNP
jgi:hypothetical protein